MRPTESNAYLSSQLSALPAEPRALLLPHKITYIAVFVFTIVLYFRPYEMFPFLSGFKTMASWAALIAVLAYIVTQTIIFKPPTLLTIETKCILFIASWALLLMPLSRDVKQSWEVFSDPFVKVVVLFIIMANILRSLARIKGLMFLGIAIGAYLSYQAFELYRQGVFNTDGTRVSINFGGMFGNPNDLCIHLLIFIPISIAFGLCSRNLVARLTFYFVGAFMTFAIILTSSRGGFLGLIAVSTMLIWKLGKGRRFRAFLIGTFFLLCIAAVIPSTFSSRMGTIFDPSEDPESSSGQRLENLERSVATTLRNPLGVGLGNSKIFGVRNLETHNSYTQVSSELGWLAFGAYLTFLFYPLRRLSKLEADSLETGQRNWIYFLAVGTQAGLVGFMVSSFFGSVAYQWYVYYPVAYAIGLSKCAKLKHDRSSVNEIGPQITIARAVEE